MPGSVIAGQVGPAQAASGVNIPPRLGILGDLILSELHGRFFESNFRDALFSGGMTLTSISNVTFTTGTTGATATPIAGIYNPISNNKNAIVLQAILSLTVTALQATGGAPFVWVTSTSQQSVITTGGIPINRKTLQPGGSVMKNLAGVALTGLTGTLASILGASALGGGSYSNAALLGTAAGFQTQQVTSVENIDGGFIVPPGGILALMATTTPVAHSAASMLIWEEVIATVV